MSESPSGWKLWEAEIRPRRERGMDHGAIAAELGLETGYVADLDLSWSTPHAVATGPELFRDVLTGLRVHYHMEQPWHYVVTALFIFQAWVTELLPVVFYLPIAGTRGTGKSNFLDLIAALTDALRFENVSIAAMARTMRRGRTVVMDEYDKAMGKEQAEVRDALIRSGYKARAPRYVRWDPAKKAADEIEVFGPRAFGYRGILDDALQDRGFPIPSVKPIGEGGYDFVLKNFWPKLEELPVRLKMWGEDARAAFNPTKLEEIAYSEAFREKMRTVVPKLGANRDSELVTIALLVAEMAGVDVLAELKEAGKLREIESFAASDTDLDDFRQALFEIAGPIQTGILDAAPIVRVKQAEVRMRFDSNRKARNAGRLSNSEFATLRRELIPPEWLGSHGNAVYWNVPAPFLSTLANQANPPNPGSIGSTGEVGEVGYQAVRNRVYDEDEGPRHPDRGKDAALRRAQEEALRDEREAGGS